MRPLGPFGSADTLAGMGFQTRRIEANGISYHLIDEGGHGPAVLLLHGFPDTSSLWRGQIPALVGAGFRAIAPDLRGRGQTQAPANVADYSIGGMVPDLVSLLDQLGVERAHVVGHDFGAVVAWIFAALRPDRVNRLAVLSVGHPAARGKPTLQELQKGWYRILFQFEGAEDLVKQDDWYLFRELLQGNGDAEEYIADLSRPGALTAGLSWYRASVPLSSIMAPPSKLPAVQARTLGIWSAGDDYLNEATMLRSADFVTGGWRYERFDDASHWIPLDQPERLNKLLLEFLA
jgi:pimeloyl-ACP methyl ester carboxylesterase